jgi:hypothetical protein
LDNARFCRTARGSVEELIDDLNTCLDEKYGDERTIQGLKNEAYQLIERINGYIAYLRRTQQGSEKRNRKTPDTRHQTTRPPDTRPPCG